MSPTGWTLHDGDGAFGVQINPHDRGLADALEELSEANVALDSMTIRGRIRIKVAGARYDSVLAAQKKWKEDNGG